MTATALIIDDEADIRELIALTLTRMGLDNHSAANLDEARSLLSTYDFDVCLTDMRLPDGNGVEFLRYIHSKHPNLPVAVITAHGNMDAAVEAMKNGAFDFVSKPVDIKQLRQLVVQAITLNSSGAATPASNDSQYDAKHVESHHNNEQSIHTLEPTDETSTLQALSGRELLGTNNTDNNSLQAANGTQLIGDSQPMQELRRMIAKVARSNAPVWITGESGTGKELIARLIHENSPRRDNAFVAINCGAIPNELMESEFFGHLKGSFTGASNDKLGLFQQADSGTLFLDEVAELPLHMQVKLLRAIQERSVRPVGSNQETPIDARILSASHKDLSAEVEAARFRHDLYYRLNVISLNSPSLRDRREDIPSLCESIMRKLTANMSPCNTAVTLNTDVYHLLSSYVFPGNVRELENLLERALALVDGNSISADDILLPTQSNVKEALNNRSVQTNSNGKQNSNEATRIVDALNATRWNRKQAAKQLGLTYRQLRYRIQQLGIDADDH